MYFVGENWVTAYKKNKDCGLMVAAAAAARGQTDEGKESFTMWVKGNVEQQQIHVQV